MKGYLRPTKGHAYKVPYIKPYKKTANTLRTDNAHERRCAWERRTRNRPGWVGSSIRVSPGIPQSPSSSQRTWKDPLSPARPSPHARERERERERERARTTLVCKNNPAPHFLPLCARDTRMGTNSMESGKRRP